MKEGKRPCGWNRKSSPKFWLISSVYRTRLISLLNSDLSLPPLSSLTLRQQQEANPPIPRTYNSPSHSQPPSRAANNSNNDDAHIPAPVPQRARQSPPVVPATWNPEMGIKFGGAGPAPGGMVGQDGKKSPPGQGQGWPPASGGQGTWDPNRGFKFG